jgi:hypothetical protein
MKQKTRFITSVIATAKTAETRLPWARGSRTPRAAAARGSAKAQRA